MSATEARAPIPAVRHRGAPAKVGDDECTTSARARRAPEPDACSASRTRGTGRPASSGSGIQSTASWTPAGRRLTTQPVNFLPDP